MLFMGSQRVRHNLATEQQHVHYKDLRRREKWAQNATDAVMDEKVPSLRYNQQNQNIFKVYSVII